MSTQPIATYSQNDLVALMFPEDRRLTPFAFVANQILSRGQVLGLVSSANQSCVQTITLSGSPAGGYLGQIVFGYGVVYPTTLLAYNVSAADMQAALEALPNIGAGNVLVGLAGSVYTITFRNALANQPQPLLQLINTAFTGGTNPAAAIAQTQTGIANNKLIAYNGSVVSAPAAPTVAGNGSGSAFAAGTYLVQVTYLTASGETTPSPATAVTLTAAQNIRVSAISSVNANYAAAGAPITGANFYVNGVWAGTAAISSGNIPQTDLSGSALATGKTPPLTNTATQYTDGRQTARFLLPHDVATDPFGNITLGKLPNGGDKGKTFLVDSVIFRGVFDTSELVGLDSAAVASMGRLLSGTVASGMLEMF